MRAILIGLLAVGFTGCGLEILTTTAIQGELAAQSAGTAARALEYAKDSTQQNNAQHAIDLYKAEKGENPPSLEALVPAYLEAVPTRPDGSPFGYDPVSGRLLDSTPVAVVAPAATAGGSDWEKLAAINAAVQKYGQDTGQYPVSLYTLVPTYLPSVPKAANGQEFVYDPRYGAVYLPQAGAVPAAPGYATPQAPARAARGGAVGGVGPMGEVMTGIGISNQLDNMSNAGTSRAQSHAGESSARAQAQHNQQQEKALQDLGM